MARTKGQSIAPYGTTWLTRVGKAKFVATKAHRVFVKTPSAAGWDFPCGHIY